MMVCMVDFYHKHQGQEIVVVWLEFITISLYICMYIFLYIYIISGGHGDDQLSTLIFVDFFFFNVQVKRFL